MRAERSGCIAGLDAEKVGVAAMLLGAGRGNVDDPIDHAVGVIVRARPGQQVRAGDTILEVHYRDDTRLTTALDLLRRAPTIADEASPASSLILEAIT